MSSLDDRYRAFPSDRIMGVCDEPSRAFFIPAAAAGRFGTACHRIRLAIVAQDIKSDSRDSCSISVEHAMAVNSTLPSMACTIFTQLVPTSFGNLENEIVFCT